MTDHLQNVIDTEILGKRSSEQRDLFDCSNGTQLGERRSKQRLVEQILKKEKRKSVAISCPKVLKPKSQKIIKPKIIEVISNESPKELLLKMSDTFQNILFDCLNSHFIDSSKSTNVQNYLQLKLNLTPKIVISEKIHERRIVFRKSSNVSKNELNEENNQISRSFEVQINETETISENVHLSNPSNAKTTNNNHLALFCCLDSSNQTTKPTLYKIKKMQTSAENNSPLKKSKMEAENFGFDANKLMAKLKTKIEMGNIVYFSDFVEKMEKIANKILSKYHNFNFIRFLEHFSTFILSNSRVFKTSTMIKIKQFESELSKFRTNVDKFPLIPLQPRLYKEIKEYKSIFSDFNDDFLQNKYSIDKLLKSDMKGSCFNCKCSNNLSKGEKFCQFNISQGGWKCECIDKQLSIECDDNCKCDPNCSNRLIQQGKREVFGKTINTQLCWGIDLFTRNSIFHMLPLDPTLFSTKLKIMSQILQEINTIGVEGWNMTLTFEKLENRCKTLVSKEKTTFSFVQNTNGENNHIVQEKKLGETENHEIETGRKTKISTKIVGKKPVPENFIKSNALRIKKAIQKKRKKPCQNNPNVLLKTSLDVPPVKNEVNICKNAYKTLKKLSMICQAREFFRIYSKGIGVVSHSQSVISENSLITEYFGEVYPVWYWYIKQDTIKQFLSHVKRSKTAEFLKYKNNYSMDFYNIILEKNVREENGKEIVVIDPIFNGNFASRLSHSCNPNCCTFPVVSQGRYFIGLYAIRDIQPGEELTFDYCSFTENQKEYEDSICLCGTEVCNGHYLHYAKKHITGFLEDKSQFSINQYLLDRPHYSFMKCNALILKSHETFSQIHADVLASHSIGLNTFKFSPDWLKVWAYFTLQTILEERNKLYLILLNCSIDTTYEKLTQTQKTIKLEIEDLYYQRIHNFIVSIDKAQQFLSKQEDKKLNKPPIRLLKHFEVLVFYSFMVTSLFNRIQKTDKNEKLEKLNIFFSNFILCEIKTISQKVGNNILKNDVDFQKKVKKNQKEDEIIEEEEVETFSHEEITQTVRLEVDSECQKVITNQELITEFGTFLKTIFDFEEQQVEDLDFITILQKNEHREIDFIRLLIVKFLVLKLSVLLSRTSSDILKCISDIAFFYSVTVNHFTNEDYKGFDVQINIRECDLTNPDKIHQKTDLSEENQIENLSKIIVSKTKLNY